MNGDKTDSPARNQRLGGAEWVKLREEVILRDGRQCANCGAKKNLEVHHVVPLSRGGTNKRTNLLTICDRCHNHTHKRQTHDQGAKTEDHRWLLRIDDVRQLIRSTRHPLRRAVIGLFAKTGIGVGELCNVNMSDISLPDSTILETYDIPHLDWAKNDIPLLRIQVPSKQERYSTRRERSETTIVPLDEETCHFIERWLAIRPDAVSRAEPLFLSTTNNWGERISLAIVGHIVRSRSEEIQFISKSISPTSITPYDLRYFFDERFSGQPRVRDYILGRRTLQEFSIEDIYEYYTKQIYCLS